MTRTISPLFLLRKPAPPTLQKKITLPCLAAALAGTVCFAHSAAVLPTDPTETTQSGSHNFTQTGSRRGSACVRMRRKPSHKVSHPSTPLGCLQLSDQHITIQKSEALEKSVRAEQEPLLNSRGFFKSKKAHNFSPWHLDPALTAEVLSVPRLTVSHKWMERGMRWKHLTSMVFGKLNGRTWVKKKKVRAAQQLQSARGVCVKKESTLKWLFSLAVYLDKTKRAAELIWNATLRPSLRCCQDYCYRNT